jgi:hypothetical protein
MDDHDPQLAGSTLSWLLHFTGGQLFSYRVTVVGKRDKRISDKGVIHALRSPPQGRRFRFPYRGFFQGASPLYVNTGNRPRFSHTPLSCIKRHGRQEARLIENGSRGFAPTWSCLSASSAKSLTTGVPATRCLRAATQASASAALGSVDIHRNQTMKDAIATNAKNDAVVLS